MISGGVRRSKLHEERRLKITKKPNFNYRDKEEEEKARHNQEVRIRNNKLIRLIKTKN